MTLVWPVKQIFPEHCIDRNAEDQRTIANRLAAAEVGSHHLSRPYKPSLTQQQQEEEPADDPEVAAAKEDPTLPVSTAPSSDPRGTALTSFLGEDARKQAFAGS